MFLLPISIIYFIFLIAGISINAANVESDVVKRIFTPILMPTLILLFLLNARNVFRFERIFIVLALCFSCLGDILLMLPGDDLFVFGLISFLVGHISYIISFISRIRNDTKSLRERLSVLTMIILSYPFLAYLSFVLTMICPILFEDKKGWKNLIAPVIIYASVIASMAYVSCLRNRQMPGYWCVAFGAVIFIMSDSFIAFNKFVTHIPQAGLLIMLTYGIGQYLLTIGNAQLTTEDFKIGRSNIYLSI